MLLVRHIIPYYNSFYEEIRFDFCLFLLTFPLLGVYVDLETACTSFCHM